MEKCKSDKVKIKNKKKEIEVKIEINHAKYELRIKKIIG